MSATSAVSAPPDDTAQRLLANAVQHHRAGELDQAIQLYERLLKFVPDMPAAHANLGVALRARGRLEEAEASYLRSLALAPDSADVLFNLGNLKRDQGDLAAAAETYRKVLARDSEHGAARTNLGLVLRDLGRAGDALAEFDQAAALQPDRAEPQLNLALALHDLRHFVEAVRACHRALALNPRYVAAINLLGQCLRQLGHLQEAAACHRRAVELAPDLAEAHAGLGQTLVAEGWLGEAIVCFDQALDLDANHLQARLGRAYVNLVLGRWGPGFEDYRWRRHSRELGQRIFEKPLWDGSDVSGKRILLHAEQGFGDTLAAIRYAPLVRELGAEVFVECQPALKRLFAPITGISRLLSTDEPVPEHDLQAPLMDLPRLFGTYPATVPPAPELRPDPALGRKFEPLLEPAERRLRVGIVWGGNPAYGSDSRRSVSLDRFLPLARLPNVQLVSLQKGPQAGELQKLSPEVRVIDAGPLLGDFADTAALVERLDLVVMVDSAVGHLAGTLGRPVWLLLPFMPHWFWLLDREDTPWYPTMRLFRQPKPGDWDPVFARVRDELQRFDA